MTTSHWQVDFDLLCLWQISHDFLYQYGNLVEKRLKTRRFCNATI